MKTMPFDIKPGMYEYKRTIGDFKKHIHLRMENDGNGVLLVNASRLYHFNSSAAFMAFHILEETDDKRTIKYLQSNFNVKKKQAVQDYYAFKTDLTKIITPGEESCPICDLNMDSITPFSKHPSAPYRMDIALTYRCNNRCIHCYNDPGRIKDELKIDQWRQVLDNIWDLGIPHVIFTGGEPTLISFLPELISYAENLGMITGLNTNGRKLHDPSYFQTLVSAGLDHVQITLESHDEEIHDFITDSAGAWKQTTNGITEALKSQLFVMTNTTLLRSNSAALQDTLQYLSAIGVPTIGLNGLIYAGRGSHVDDSISEDKLPELLEIAKSHVEQSMQKLIWYTPTMYCYFNPIEFELGVKGCTAALYNMCIEPDGSVLPCQSYYQSLGNILFDPWNSIWNHELAQSIRERKFAPQVCHACEIMDVCGAGCPLHLQIHPEKQPQPVNIFRF